MKSTHTRFIARLIVGIFFISLPGLSVGLLDAEPIFAQEKKPAEQQFIAPKLNVAIPGLDFSKYPIVKGASTISIPFLAAYIGAFYKYLVGISVVAAAVMIVYGGFLYIVKSTSGGVARGKEIVVDAVIGLLLILGSYTILATINPSTVTTFKPLELTYINRDLYLSHSQHLDGVPLEELERQERGEPVSPPTAPPEPQPQPGPPEPGVPEEERAEVGSGCVAAPFYQLPPGKCAGEACLDLYCKKRDYTLEGVPSPKDLVGFEESFPPTVGEQIAQKGITFLVPKLCLKKDRCDPKDYLAIKLFGQGVSISNRQRMDVTIRFRPEVRDALIKAGAAAKAKGYFLVIGDGTRTMETQAVNWCTRIKEKGSALGMAVPGQSAHQLGIAVDIALVKLDEQGRTKLLTVLGAICEQVKTQMGLGADNLKILEAIMASAGFKHMCEEVWHFNYKGMNKIDCSECVFPGAMQKLVERRCKK